MSNPAGQLKTLLSKWDVPKSTQPELARGIREMDSLTFWRSQAQAVELLRHIERILGSMEASGNSVDHYRQALPAWYAAAFAFSTPWNSSTHSLRPALNASAMAMLAALDGQIQAMGLDMVLTQTDIDRLLELLAEAEELTRSEEEISEDVRRYVLGLLTEARKTIADVDTFGAASLRSITAELGGAIVTVAGQAHTEGRKKRWIDLAKAILVPWTVATGSAIATETIKAIAS